MIIKKNEKRSGNGAEISANLAASIRNVKLFQNSDWKSEEFPLTTRPKNEIRRVVKIPIDASTITR
jgi:hypothetical protein